MYDNRPMTDHLRLESFFMIIEFKFNTLITVSVSPIQRRCTLDFYCSTEEQLRVSLFFVYS